MPKRPLLMVLPICAGLALLAVACSMPALASPAELEHCTKLYLLWARYGQHPTFHHTGQRARAELAVEDCRADHYEDGLAELEELLRRNRIPIPPPATKLARPPGG